MAKPIEILAVGDVGIRRADPATMLAAVAPRFAKADLVVGQLETTVSTRGEPVPNARLAMRAPPAMLAACRAAGIGAMSFAGNHCLDWGYTAFHDTLDHAATARIALCGAGADLDAASRPVLVRAGPLTVALVGASAILPDGYAAEPGKPGCAPLRAHTAHVPAEPDQPHTPARIHSFPDMADLARLTAAVADARAAADVVLVSLHWGIHMIRATIADYQPIVARALIDAGADAVVGHHPHILKGIDFHRGKPIFYSLGNFAIEQPHVWNPAIVDTASFRHLVSLNPGWTLDQGYMLPPETRHTGAARLLFAPDGTLVETGFLPAWIDDRAAPRFPAPEAPEFATTEAYLRDICREAGLSPQLQRRADEIVLSPPA